MAELEKYVRKDRTAVTAVRLDLETDGFTYEKWGATQRCKPGDWIVGNDGETYTIDAESFAKTYRKVGEGRYEKREVWAERAEAAGAMPTKEGSTDYSAGDMLVYNDADRRDGYAMPAQKFDSLYRPADA
jgi:hypothetical protein